MGAAFARFASHTSRVTGSHWALAVAACGVGVSLIALGVEITNILISIATLLMLFILQNTQNRDSAALHLKMDEAMRVLPEARDRELRGLESRSDSEIEAVRRRDHLGLDEPSGVVAERGSVGEGGARA
jgi:low affinity Fe/Cu permease